MNETKKGIPYSEDACPKCGQRCIAACRCLLNDRKCPNGHWWRREYKTDKAIMLDGPHGEPIKETEEQETKDAE